MSESVRPGFENARLLRLADEGGDALVQNSTPEQRLLMVWPLTCDAWAFFGTFFGAFFDPEQNHAQREFQRHIESIKRGHG